MWNFGIKNGPAISFWLLALAAQMSGWTNTAMAFGLVGIAVFFLMAPACHQVRQWQLKRNALGKPMTTPQLILLISVSGAWAFMTVGAGSVAFIIWTGQPFTTGSSAIVGDKPDDGPLIWYRNLSMEGGPTLGRNVFAITFSGGNISEKEVELKSASIVSAVNGSRVKLEIVAQGESVPLDAVELIPPGAPVRLVAKFGLPDPSAPGKILGIDPKVFADIWSKFSLNIQDDTKSYRIPFNEGDIAPFFPGLVGPHVSKKASPAK